MLLKIVATNDSIDPYNNSSVSIPVTREEIDKSQARVSEILNISDAPTKEAILDIQDEAYRFLHGVGAMVKGPLGIIQMLLNIWELLNIQRFILYRIVNATEAEILLIFSYGCDEPNYAGQIIPLHENINLNQTVVTGKPSRLPVEWLGIDAAFPIGSQQENANKLVVWVDTSGEARTFSPKDLVSLIPTASNLANLYNFWHSTYIKWVDALTWLLNRWSFNQAIDNGKDVFDAPISPIKTVVYFDIDFFKSFNDVHWHHTGDAVLKHVASFVRQKVEALWGNFFRYGGEEFVATFPTLISHDEIDAIRESVGATVCEFEWVKHEIKLSVWYSTVEHHGDIDPANYIALQKRMCKAADAALYRAKHTGRNRTIEWEAIAK